MLTLPPSSLIAFSPPSHSNKPFSHSSLPITSTATCISPIRHLPPEPGQASTGAQGERNGHLPRARGALHAMSG